MTLNRASYLVKKFQIDVDNVVLYNKLVNIENKKPSNKMPTFHLKKDNMTGHKKKEIVNMAQENLHMFKRLKEKTSYYDFGNMIKNMIKHNITKDLIVHCYLQ